MTYRAILVHVPLGDAKVQVELAAKLAKESEAHLTGLCALTEVAMLRNARQNPFLRLETAKVEDLIGHEYEGAALAEKQFNAIAKHAGVAHSWLIGEGDAADLLIHAPCQPLAGSRGRAMQRSRRSAVGPSRAARALRSSGADRAAQMAVAGVRQARVCRMEWKRAVGRSRAQGTAAARARREGHGAAGDVARGVPQRHAHAGARCCGYLKHEGVAIGVKTIDVDDDAAGEAILKQAKQSKSDLIVMGAFGGSRFREWILGGATRHVLENMTVPVLMAH